MIDHIGLYLSRIGTKGGRSKSTAKIEAAIRNARLAREAKEYKKRLDETKAKTKP